MAPQTVPPAISVSLALALVASSSAPLLLLDNSLTVVAASASFCGAFKIDPQTASGCPLAALGGGEWNIPQLLGLLHSTISGHADAQEYELSLVRPGEVSRQLVVNARKLSYGGDGETSLVLSVADITDARAAEKLKDSLLHDKDVLLQELHHRVANSLQIIASVLMQSARKVQSEETRSHLHDAHHRVMSVAALQKQLAASRLGNVEMRPYLQALCVSIGGSMIRDPAQIFLKATVDDSVATADTSVSLGLIVTELVINALKHAFPGNRAGNITVDYNSRGPNWKLSVGDDGVGIAENPDSSRPGLGTSIVQALAHQLGAQVSVTAGAPGTTVAIIHTFTPALVTQAGPKVLSL